MVWLNALTRHLQPQAIQARERAQIRAIKDSIGHVEVFQMDGVGTPIIGRPRPIPGHDTPNPANNTYTLNYEEPGFIRSGSERKDSKRPLIVGYKETVSGRDIFLSINAARIPVGPLSRIPIRLHERPGMLVRALDELEVVRRGNSNPHTAIVSTNRGLVAHLPTMWQ